MRKIPPSIFNDVIGPVMRGPSSSHTAASVRIGKMIGQILNDRPVKVDIEFDREGSLATTYQSQGSSIGLAAGLLNWDVTHPELMSAPRIAEEKGIDINYRITSYEADHPNTYRIFMEGQSGKKKHIDAISHGGGVVEIISINNIPIAIRGDYYEVLCFFSTGSPAEKISSGSLISDHVEQVNAVSSGNQSLVQIKLSAPPEGKWLDPIRQIPSISEVIIIEPVMPVLSFNTIEIPFSTVDELLRLVTKESIDLARAAMIYESQRSRMSEVQVLEMMKEIVMILTGSLKEGLKGTSYKDRILGYQSGKYGSAYRGGQLLGDKQLNRVIEANMAMMEMKSSMGLIVAAPTAGSCATLPGTLIPIAEEMKLVKDDLVRAFLASGLIGIFIANRSTFAAEECGCQAECGSASGMVAAGLVQLMGGTVKEGLAAASMALQNMIGLVCDPVANRVEVPCLGKNILGSMNGLSSANMAMAGLDEVIPLDEVIQAMDEAGRSLPRTLRCTGLGGLSLTETSKKIEKRMRGGIEEIEPPDNRK